MVEKVDCDPSNVKMDTPLDELLKGDLKREELQFELESEVGGIIDDSLMDTWKTVEDIVRYLELMESPQEPETIAITVIIKDHAVPFWPLIYTVNVRRTDVDDLRLLPDEESTARIKRLVAEERHKDCGVSVKILEEYIELLFAFKGDLHPVCDWRF